MSDCSDTIELFIVDWKVEGRRLVGLIQHTEPKQKIWKEGTKNNQMPAPT